MKGTSHLHCDYNHLASRGTEELFANLLDVVLMREMATGKMTMLPRLLQYCLRPDAHCLRTCWDPISVAV